MEENLLTVWPVLYFKADWLSKRYNFDLGVQLIKADKTMLEEVTRWDVDNNCWLSNIQGADNMRANTDWFLAMPRPEVAEHVSVNKLGMSFVDALQRSIVESFLMTLQLVHSTAAICPFEFPAKIREDSVDDVDTSDDFYGINSDMPPVYLPETFKIGDLQLLTDLWSAIVRLRKFYDWKVLINKEEFFAACDKKAGEDATKKLVDIFMTHPYYASLSDEEKAQNKKSWTASIKEMKEKGKLGELWKNLYRDSFSETFSDEKEKMFSDRTRIGRALNLFFEGIQLPLQHSYLSMCLVLETLFTVDKGETTHKLTTRLAKLIGGDEKLEERKQIYKRAKKVYKERGDIVHGEKLIETENDAVVKDGFIFTRRSLQRILLDSELLKLYSDPGTTDKKVKGKIRNAAKKAIKNHFLNLDLR